MCMPVCMCRKTEKDNQLVFTVNFCAAPQLCLCGHPSPDYNSLTRFPQESCTPEMKKNCFYPDVS